MRQCRSVVAFVGVLLVAVGGHPKVADAQPGTVVTAPPSTAPEEQPVAIGMRVDSEPLAAEPEQVRLGQWLEFMATSERRTRLTAGSQTLIASAITMGLGIWAFVDSPPNTELNKGVGLMLVGSSGIFMSIGIVQLAKESRSEERFKRWQAARGPELTRREFARFEGEFRAQSGEEERAVVVGRWTSFGTALTGGLVLGLTPVANLSHDAAMIGYISGGVALGVGMLGFGFSFLGRSKPDSWTAYVSGQGPPTSVKWSAAPAVGRKFVGAHLVGQF